VPVIHGSNSLGGSGQHRRIYPRDPGRQELVVDRLVREVEAERFLPPGLDELNGRSVSSSVMYAFRDGSCLPLTMRGQLKYCPWPPWAVNVMNSSMAEIVG